MFRKSDVFCNPWLHVPTLPLPRRLKETPCILLRINLSIPTARRLPSNCPQPLSYVEAHVFSALSLCVYCCTRFLKKSPVTNKGRDPAARPPRARSVRMVVFSGSDQARAEDRGHRWRVRRCERGACRAHCKPRRRRPLLRTPHGGMICTCVRTSPQAGVLRVAVSSFTPRADN